MKSEFQNLRNSAAQGVTVSTLENGGIHGVTVSTLENGGIHVFILFVPFFFMYYVSNIIKN